MASGDEQMSWKFSLIDRTVWKRKINTILWSNETHFQQYERQLNREEFLRSILELLQKQKLIELQVVQIYLDCWAVEHRSKRQMNFLADLFKKFFFFLELTDDKLEDNLNG